MSHQDDKEKHSKRMLKELNAIHKQMKIAKSHGTFNQANRYAQYRSYSQARNFAIKLKLKSSSDWYRYSKSGKKPKDIPSSPIIVYRKEWKVNGGWGGFLGTGNVASQEKSKNYLPFDEARKEARKLQKKYHLKTWTDWVKAYHERKIPKNIPLLPDRVYSKKRKKDGEKTGVGRSDQPSA